jgi:hypothetical protein
MMIFVLRHLLFTLLGLYLRLSGSFFTTKEVGVSTFYIMKKVAENEISAGKDPMRLAATVIYISCIKTGEHISQKEISHAASLILGLLQVEKQICCIQYTKNYCIASKILD